jgi:hypothetical protein
MEALQGGHLSPEQVTVLDAKRRGKGYLRIKPAFSQSVNIAISHIRKRTALLLQWDPGC